MRLLQDAALVLTSLLGIPLLLARDAAPKLDSKMIGDRNRNQIGCTRPPRSRGVRLELDGNVLERLQSPIGGVTRAAVEEIIAGLGRAFLGYAPYRRGSAFVRNAPHG
jgi:hypothetical protein